jgi:hypothetical protein
MSQMLKSVTIIQTIPHPNKATPTTIRAIPQARRVMPQACTGLRGRQGSGTVKLTHYRTPALRLLARSCLRSTVSLGTACAAERSIGAFGAIRSKMVPSMRERFGALLDLAHRLFAGTALANGRVTSPVPIRGRQPGDERP